MMKRKMFIGCITAFALTIIATSKGLGQAPDNPNVLFIAIDDMNDWTNLFDEGNPIQTPNLKRLAARGTFFTRAYCASPGCNPSRTAIMTGYRPTTSGVYGNNTAWAELIPDAVTLPKCFEQSGGYATRGAGKIFHHGGTEKEPEGKPAFQEFFKKLGIRSPGLNKNYNGYKKNTNPRARELGSDLRAASWGRTSWGRTSLRHWNRIIYKIPAGIFLL